jgi:hypothetical protein
MNGSGEAQLFSAESSRAYVEGLRVEVWIKRRPAAAPTQAKTCTNSSKDEANTCTRTNSPSASVAIVEPRCRLPQFLHPDLVCVYVRACVRACVRERERARARICVGGCRG